MRSGRTEPADRRLPPPLRGGRGTDPVGGSASGAGSGFGIAPLAAMGGLFLLGLFVTAVACAQQRSPPGVAPDARPPELLEAAPADRTVVPGFDGSLRLRFDEPISVPSGYEREIFFSPADRIRVSYGFSEITVRPENGWRENAVYLVRFPDGISDIPPLNNATEETIQLVFSTGPAITRTVVTGTVRDRVSGEPVQDGRVLFLSGSADSVPYTAVSDTAGRFELPALPPGEYRAFGFTDLNSNLQLERRIEPYDSTTFRLEDESDAASIELRITEPDSTPPVLRRVDAADSVTLALEFDDPLDPEQELRVDQVTVRGPAGRERSVSRVRLGEPAGAPTEAVGREALRAEDEEPDPEDPLEDTLPDPEAPPAADTLPAEGEDAPTPARRPGAAVPGDTARLPSPVLRVRLARALEPGEYVVSARDLRNLRMLTGGGEVRFEYTLPETPADTTSGAPADTTSGAPADTTSGARSDSTPAGSDRTPVARPGSMPGAPWITLGEGSPE